MVASGLYHRSVRSVDLMRHQDFSFVSYSVALGDPYNRACHTLPRIRRGLALASAATAPPRQPPSCPSRRHRNTLVPSSAAAQPPRPSHPCPHLAPRRATEAPRAAASSASAPPVKPSSPRSSPVPPCFHMVEVILYASITIPALVRPCRWALAIHIAILP